MSNTAKSGKPAEQARRDLEISAATARECLWATHVTYALELIERMEGEVPPIRALGIYLRLHGIAEEEAKILRHRVLVTLGQHPITEQPSSPDGDEEEEEWEGSHSLVFRIQKRLRGRVNPELRRWVELHTGRAEVALLQVHVDFALRFVEILKPETSYAEAVDVYVEMVGVKAPWAQAVYFFALQRLSEVASGTVYDFPGSEPAAPVLAQEPTLRILESGG